MWSRIPKSRRSRHGAAVLAEAPTDEFAGSDDELAAEITRLTDRNRVRPSSGQERLLLHLRNLLGIRRLEGDNDDPGYPEPDIGALPAGSPLPEVRPGDLSPGLLRAGILRSGCVLVRGLVDRPSEAQRFARQDRPCLQRARSPRR